MKNDFNIVIDAGHGGTNRGCCMGAIDEAEYVLSIANRLFCALEKIPGVNSFPTRIHDVSMSLDYRGDVSSYIKPDLVISIHVNSFENDDLKGLMTFCKPGDHVAESMGDLIQMAAPRSLQRSSLTTIKTSPTGWKSRAHAVLEPHECPAVLVECGFASHPQNLEYMLSDEGKDSIVRMFIAAILEYVIGVKND